MRLASTLLAVCAASFAGLVIGQTVGQTMTLGKPIEGNAIQEIKFDEGLRSKRPLPTVPKGWRFVGVSSGHKNNSNNLWFQDQTGNIYLVRGFNTDSEFVLQDDVHHLGVAK